MKHTVTDLKAFINCLFKKNTYFDLRFKLKGHLFEARALMSLIHVFWSSRARALPVKSSVAGVKGLYNGTLLSNRETHSGTDRVFVIGKTSPKSDSECSGMICLSMLTQNVGTSK